MSPCPLSFLKRPAASLKALAIQRKGNRVGLDGFDPSSDAAFLDRLYMPGLRRAGDLQTAVAAARGELVLHGAGPAFHLAGPRVERRRLTVGEIATLARR